MGALWSSHVALGILVAAGTAFLAIFSGGLAFFILAPAVGVFGLIGILGKLTHPTSPNTVLSYALFAEYIWMAMGFVTGLAASKVGSRLVGSARGHGIDARTFDKLELRNAPALPLALAFAVLNGVASMGLLEEDVSQRATSLAKLNLGMFLVGVVVAYRAMGSALRQHVAENPAVPPAPPPQLCVQCGEFVGTEDKRWMCSNCYRASESTNPVTPHPAPPKKTE